MYGRPSGCIDQLTTMERSAIITLHKVGWIGCDIAKVIKCSENSVSLWINRWNNEHSVSDEDRSGRPHILDEYDSHSIIQYSHEHHTAEPKAVITPESGTYLYKIFVCSHGI
jgi:transposase